MSDHPNDLLIRLSYILIIVFNACLINASPTVHIKNGTLMGLTMRTRLGKELAGYRGIPYALPPLGPLRFKAPEPAAAWSGVRKAVEDAEICVQRNIYTYQEKIVGSEDCLYLNVYSPLQPEGEPKKRYPVMIWFHGGGWITGAGHSEFYGPKFLLDHDVVLVTINYRLGPLGFLSTEDMACPGNLGLKDQQQAMRWVQENIDHFGGDSNRVTLFGESAGGASVHYHMINPVSQDFFHRAISQSGTVYCPWTLAPPGSAKRKAEQVGRLLNCDTESSEQLIECLRKKSATDLIGTDRSFQVYGYCPMIPFKPVIEPDHPGAFIVENPIISMHKGNMADIPWMTGVTSEEGSLKVAGIYGRDQGKHVRTLHNEFMDVAPLSLMYEEWYNITDKSFRDVITKTIRKYYFGHNTIDESDDSRFKVIKMYSDAWFNHGAHIAVQDFIVNQSSPIYYYYFTYNGSISFSTIFGDDTKSYGVAHADELQYLFPVGEQLFKSTPLSEEDHHMIDVMTTLWTNFAKFGNPTPKVTDLIPVKWISVKTPSSPEYLTIGNSREISMAKSLNWSALIQHNHE
ncbi:venom carboxylesterase-6 isoform X2 [Ooceraea biroi]|uniref:venom carboxylesterase-6 isoform X2 n=1 Tax=Ooceraea biroi TaxID=2015173 RepID=UPI000F076686|nr:venom carboxylesterase-6 isoform X2 [Ooceraea biroi]